MEKIMRKARQMFDKKKPQSHEREELDEDEKKFQNTCLMILKNQKNPSMKMKNYVKS